MKTCWQTASRSDETWRGALVPLETVDAAVDESLFVVDVTWRGAAGRGGGRHLAAAADV
jgi:hypothetical protein